MRKIAQFDSGNMSVKVYRDIEWNEYRVKIYRDNMHEESADYHTDDKEDALDTAKSILQTAYI
jgi:hypothetical protein